MSNLRRTVKGIAVGLLLLAAFVLVQTDEKIQEDKASCEASGGDYVFGRGCKHEELLQVPEK